MNKHMQEKQLRGSHAYPIVLYHMPNEQHALYAPFHWQEDVEILSITSGMIELIVKSQVLILHCGEVVCINAGELHSFRAITQDAECDIFIFPPEHLLFAKEDHDQQRFLHPLIDGQLGFPLKISGNSKELILQAIDLQKKHPIAYKIHTKILLLQWIILLAQDDAFLPLHSSRQSDVCKEILTYIQQHFTEHLTVSEVATAVGISPTYFSAFFTEHFSQRFVDYLRSIRIEHACTLLLNTSMSITEIALATGFSSGSHFISLFRQTMKMTPLAYRRSLSE